MSPSPLAQQRPSGHVLVLVLASSSGLKPFLGHFEACVAVPTAGAASPCPQHRGDTQSPRCHPHSNVGFAAPTSTLPKHNPSGLRPNQSAPIHISLLSRSGFSGSRREGVSCYSFHSMNDLSGARVARGPLAPLAVAELCARIAFLCHISSLCEGGGGLFIVFLLFFHPFPSTGCSRFFVLIALRTAPPHRSPSPPPHPIIPQFLSPAVGQGFPGPFSPLSIPQEEETLS